MGWSHDSIISEYSAYAHPKVRETDIKYIDGFDPANVSVSVDTLHWRAGKSKTPRSLSDIRKWIKFIAFVLAMACLWGLTYSDLRLVR
jgi:tyrosine-protein phosphatase SIW14